jgi:hypothetical protein
MSRGLWLLVTAAVVALSLLQQPIASAAEVAPGQDPVRDSIARARQWIIDQRQPSGLWAEDKNYDGGHTCLAIYTLAYIGEDPRGDVLGPALAEMAKLSPTKVYVRAVRAMAFSAVVRKLEKTDVARAKAVRAALHDDVRWLIDAQGTNGGWNYLPMRPEETRFDFSNTQLTILALWQAMLAGEEVPPTVWIKARKIYYEKQLPEGAWSYGDPVEPGARGSMTAAGLASIYIIGDMLDLESNCPCRAVKDVTKDPDLYPTMEKAMRWLGAEFRPDSNPGQGNRWLIYWLYSVERVGIAAGYRALGTHDWYREGSAYLLREQREDGSWANTMGPLVDTCFATLFLYKGRAPLVFEKLQCGSKGEWNAHRRDLANLCAFFEKNEEYPVRWQVVTLETPVEDLREAPILYISLNAPVQFTADEKKKLRQFTDAGGTILVEAVCGHVGVRSWFQGLAREVWPEWPLKVPPTGHGIYADPYKLKARPELLGIDDGIRTILFFAQDDISCPWQTKAFTAKEYLFQFGINLYTYASDHWPLRGLPASEMAPRFEKPVKAGAMTTLAMARLKTGGDWDVGRQYKGLAMLTTTLAKRAEVTLKVEDDGVVAADLGDRQAAFFTGVKAPVLSDGDRKDLKAWLAKGGFLWAEAANGSGDFDKGFRKLAAEMGWDLKIIERTEPLMTGRFTKAAGYDISKGLRFRYVLRRDRAEVPWADLVGIWQDGRLVGVYSPLDVLLTATPCQAYNCRGYRSEDAAAVGANIILYLTDR